MPLWTLPVRDVVVATPRTRTLRLAIGDTGFTYAAGQAVMVGLHASPVRKPYSIASAPSESARTGWLELLVQVDDSGGPDPHLERAAAGTPLDLDGPFGRFSVPDLARHLLLVAGGTGIAPLRSMAVEALARRDVAAIHVVHSARTAGELAYREQLASLAEAGRLRVWHTVTRDQSPDWPGRRGRIDGALLEEALPGPDSVCLVCGPEAFVVDVRARLRAIGVADDRIGVERYE